MRRAGVIDEGWRLLIRGWVSATGVAASARQVDAWAPLLRMLTP